MLCHVHLLLPPAGAGWEVAQWLVCWDAYNTLACCVAMPLPPSFLPACALVRVCVLACPLPLSWLLWRRCLSAAAWPSARAGAARYCRTQASAPTASARRRRRGGDGLVEATFGHLDPSHRVTAVRWRRRRLARLLHGGESSERARECIDDVGPRLSWQQREWAGRRTHVNGRRCGAFAASSWWFTRIHEHRQQTHTHARACARAFFDCGCTLPQLFQARLTALLVAVVSLALPAVLLWTHSDQNIGDTH